MACVNYEIHLSGHLSDETREKREREAFLFMKEPNVLRTSSHGKYGYIASIVIYPGNLNIAMVPNS